MMPKRIGALVAAILWAALMVGGIPSTSGQVDNDTNKTNPSENIENIDELQKKAEAGDVAAQFVIGYMYLKGEGVKQDYKQAADWFRKAADQGDTNALGCLGLLYDRGWGVEQDFKKALELYHRSAEQGNVMSQFMLGEKYSDGKGVEKDSKQAEKWYRKAAENGIGEAQSKLGFMYLEGQGIVKDETQAAIWFRKSAEQGNIPAQSFIGALYYQGCGVAQDYKEAGLWFRKAAEQGEAGSQYFLGLMYDAGNGVEHSETEAIKWFKRAAGQGHYLAQFDLALKYIKGQGIEKDAKLAEIWFRKAADQGFGYAQFNLGVIYMKGEGVIEDYVEGYKWFLLAGMNGVDVQKQKQYLKEKMTPMQIAEAQRLAKEFVPKKEGESGNEAKRPKDLKTTGTGFFIDAKGHILTANHVIEKAKTIRIMAGDKILDAKVVAADAGLDIAILKVQGQGFEWLPIAASAGVKAGEKIFTVGYPNYAIQGTEPKYTEGVVNSLTGAMNNPRLFQVSAQVQPGNSGGPLVTEAGQVIGVVVQRLNDLGMLEATGMVAQSVNYAVKSTFVLPLLEGVEGWTRPEDQKVGGERSAIIERARKAAVMVMGY